jgi:hypothetical protein
VGTGEFFREMEQVKSMIHTISRDLAVAGIGGGSTGGGSSKVGANSALKTLIKQECEKKVDQERVDELLKAKADVASLREIIER